MNIPASAERRRAATAVGLAERYHHDEPDVVDDARRGLTEAQLEDHIQAVLAAAPPITQEQRQRLAGLLYPEVTTKRQAS